MRPSPRVTRLTKEIRHDTTHTPLDRRGPFGRRRGGRVHRDRRHEHALPADDTVITVHGDAVKNPLTKNGWPDGTPGNTNIVLTGITATGVD